MQGDMIKQNILFVMSTMCCSISADGMDFQCVLMRKCGNFRVESYIFLKMKNNPVKEGYKF